ncbi:MAG: response regulator [Bacteroidota bacterium]
MNPVKILIADDHTMMAQMWGAFLSKSEIYKVVDQVSSCLALKEALQSYPIDIVLLDILLSDGSSLDMIKELKILSPTTKFLAVSGYADVGTVKKAFAFGVDGYLTKTSTLEEMKEAMQVVLNGEIYRGKEVEDLFSHELSDTSDVTEKSLLTKKERQVAYWVYKGLSAKDIAEKLGISFKTVEVHRHHIYQKLGIQKSAKLMLYVQEHPHLFSDVA